MTNKYSNLYNLFHKSFVLFIKIMLFHPIFSRIIFIIFLYISYLLYLNIYEYLFLPDIIKDVNDITSLPEKIMNDVKEHNTIKTQHILPKYDKDVFINFYNLYYPDYYQTYIRPLFLETQEDKIINAAYEKYHLISLDSKLYQISEANRYVLITFLIFSEMLVMPSFIGMLYNIPVNNYMFVHQVTMGLGGLIILGCKKILLTEELESRLQILNISEDFWFNHLPDDFI